eukprot:CAMPEP_0176486638 /NCGR_PEP_ID=MMETSP0200_2-20121128/5678_1 /TAXON_ID=947934 /ORGANISM="Chaetoceros sp., Strain GSL56" /LENGTH=278 /DNA_ID=CAMNT_0017883359 /DNA_START=133 /DNA_END=966 /DNA_ORIENTATION=+
MEHIVSITTANSIEVQTPRRSRKRPSRYETSESTVPKKAKISDSITTKTNEDIVGKCKAPPASNKVPKKAALVGKSAARKSKKSIEPLEDEEDKEEDEDEENWTEDEVEEGSVVGKRKAPPASNKVPKNPNKNHFMSKKLMKYGSKVIDMVELWHHSESQFPDLQHDIMEEEGPLLLECAFRIFGATPVDYNSETDVDTHHNDQKAYMKYASAVTSLKMTRKQFNEIMHEAEEMVEMCTDGNANIGFISNLFRFLSIYLYIYEKIKISIVGKFNVVTW